VQAAFETAPTGCDAKIGDFDSGIDTEMSGDYENRMSVQPADIVVILAAGLGSRLRQESEVPKPLMSIHGRPLVLRVLDRFLEAGIDSAVVVLGHCADEVRDGIENHNQGIRIMFTVNPKFELSNGLSVLAAKPVVGDRPFFLSMSDHIFERSIIEGLAAAELPQGGLVLAVDRKLDSIYDMEDATKVQTDGRGRIARIGKQLEQFDAVDSGLFLASPALFDAIDEHSRERADRDCSLSEGVETLARRGLARVHDIGDGRWQDVDTPGSMAHAKKIFG
jgi:choline kinase